MILSKPAASEILCATAIATTANMITVPANRWYTASVTICATSTGNVTANPAVTWTPGDGTSGPGVTIILARCTVGSTSGNGSNNTSTNRILVFGGALGGTLSYAVNSAPTSSVTINGFLL